MKQPPASTTHEKLEFLRKYESRIKAVANYQEFETLLTEIMQGMRDAGLYRQTTAVVDIKINIKHRISDLGWPIFRRAE